MIYIEGVFLLLTHPHTWLPYLTPNGVTHLNNTRIEESSAFVIVGYQLFTVSFFYQNRAEKIMDFERPTR